MKLDHIQKIFFLGIGGIGMSALARYFHHLGKEVFGYDKTETALTKKLVSEGMKVHYVDDAKLIPDEIDLVVYTPAIPDDLGEMVTLRASGLPMMKRSEVLGLLSKERKTVAIAGTHGKTTTCSILSYILKECGVDANAFVGGIMKNYDSNFLLGSSDWIVVEADEYDRSFHRLFPEIAVVLAMDPDHLDIYGDRHEMLRAYRQFTCQVSPGGKLFIHNTAADYMDDVWRAELASKQIEMIRYGYSNADHRYERLKYHRGVFSFDYVSSDERIEGIEIILPGVHNVSNATVALAVAAEVGADMGVVKAKLKDFAGIKRRFEFIGMNEDHILIDDYAHHPEELSAAIRTAKTLFPDKKLTVAFQPHLFSRTNDFADGFGEVLTLADEVILTQIYPARELPMEGVTSQLIYDKIGHTKKEIIDKGDLSANIKSKDIEVLLILGAGDIDKEINKVKEVLFSE